jgi:hypothetical protein
MSSQRGPLHGIIRQLKHNCLTIKGLTEQVLVKTVEPQHIATFLDAVISEQFGPRLDHGEHSVVIALDTCLGLLDHSVVNIDGALHHIEIVDK